VGRYTSRERQPIRHADFITSLHWRGCVVGFPL
jgi:hypothetical protein